MRKQLIVLFFMAAVLSSLTAQNSEAEASVTESSPGYGFSIRQALFLPPQYYVGDRVELRLRILPVDGLDARSPFELPVQDSVEISSVTVKPQGREYQVTVVFSSYAPGRQTLPPLNLGDLVLSGLRINTASLVEEEGYQQIQEPRDQMALPSSRFLLAVTLGLLFLIPLFAVFLYRVGRDQWQRLQVWYQETRPRRQMVRHLRNLKAKVLETERREFYSQLTLGVRRYLTLKLGEDCNSATTRELAGILERWLPLDQAELFLDLFAFADRVKFASEYSSVEKQVEYLQLCLRAVLSLEGKEKLHVDL